ncbi:hypothetical protein CDL12_17613 [Handroanthus impetiginosus]|uniref:Uncharacterized protein n=1 Tax=Handroanthus impetiginosus TaxID=429701 RepID=A0A2G9GXR5_9LAMI|nr:hypothetical protein CDL12_17613 [Handroanthus impetiginosus]
MEEDGMRARSFRYEDYNTRRVFLRSYPLHWGSESEVEESIEAAEKSKEEPVKVMNRTNGKKPIRKMILAVVHWGEERILVFRRFKHKITIYVVNCVPVHFKVPTALISVK